MARHTTAAPAQQVVKVRVPPGSTAIVPRPTQPGTTYVVELEQDVRALNATRAELARAQQDLAATRQQLAQATGTLDERTRALQQREAELSARMEELSARERELTGQTEKLQSERQAREQAQRERDAALARVREIAKVKEDERGLVISLGGTLMFRHDEAILLPEARARLDRVSDALKQMEPGQKIVIEGHADATGTNEYNLRLSEERANAVRAHLLQRGVSPDQIVAVGKGEEQPIAPNQTAEGRANNRRVEIVISPSQAAAAG